MEHNRTVANALHFGEGNIISGLTNAMVYCCQCMYVLHFEEGISISVTLQQSEFLLSEEAPRYKKLLVQVEG